MIGGPKICRAILASFLPSVVLRVRASPTLLLDGIVFDLEFVSCGLLQGLLIIMVSDCITTAFITVVVDNEDSCGSDKKWIYL